MAFLGKVGSILRQNAGRQIASEISAYQNPPFTKQYDAFHLQNFSLEVCPAILSRYTVVLFFFWWFFVAGLSYSTDHQSLRESFSKYGYVAEARVILDRETGRS
ncbi:hypothetical protein Pint_16788 [Pistacia integerrima]|uniref:Uncharacterized protein n=1 Tax=Pistacia integerrima TaxID=434235 RepID=A0ACC0ZC72_9ROSI|nr:hypothetical protein Pint_16788 [Pistacia integerrima]